MVRVSSLFTLIYCFSELFLLSFLSRTTPPAHTHTPHTGKLHTLNVEKTPPPRQIIWEHINTNPIQRIWRKCISTFIFLFVIVFASYLTFWSMGSLDTDALQIDYTHCREEIAASYYSTYDFATSRAQTLTRPENPNEGNSRAILTSRDRMCLNNSRQHYDYDRSEPYEEQSYFVGFEAETNGQYWLPEYSPRIINRTFEVWTALGNIEKMYTFYDFSNVDYCFEPCWPGSTSKNRSTMCPSQSCFYDSIRPCSLFWKGTVCYSSCRFMHTYNTHTYIYIGTGMLLQTIRT